MNKRNELLHIIEQDDPDIICLTEILPKNARYPVEISELQLDGYDTFTNIKETTSHRGVIMYTKKKLSAIPSNVNTSFTESIWCEVPLLREDRLLIGCIYRSPNSTQDNNDNMNSALADVTRNKSHVLVLGDFNYPELEWVDGVSPPDLCNKATKFMEATRDAFLTQHVTEPTHFRGNQIPNTLDLIFTNEDNMISKIEHLAPIGKSHHQLLKFGYQCYTVEPQDVVDKYCFAKGDYDTLRMCMTNQDWNAMSDLSAKVSWNNFDEVLREGMKQAIPKRKTNRNQKKKPKWMNGTALSKIKEKRNLYKRYIMTRAGTDFSAYTRARNQVKWECRKAKREFEKQIAREAKPNPKAFYAYARSKMKTKDGVTDLDSAQGGTATTDLEKSKTLNGFFCSVFTKENKENVPLFDTREHGEDLTTFSITTEDVQKKLAALKPNKSPGPDGFHPMLFRELANEVAEPLRTIFQKCLDEGYVPQSWKDAHVTPIFKKGKKSAPGNYRPVSLTSIVCKVMESLVRDKVVDHMRNHNLFTDYQHGFIHGRSCSTNLLSVLDTWTEALDNRIPTDAIYLDFAKAFDTVPHVRLLNKLHGYGIKGNLLAWIENFLQNRRQCVQINGAKSEWASVTSGIPQGSVLGPCLFVIFINDLPDEVTSCIQMFADDTKVFTKVNSTEDQDKLQEDIDSLYQWSDKWQLRFNAGKCKVLHIGQNNPGFAYAMEQNGDRSILGITELEKDLGVNIDPKLNFSQHIEVQVNKANKILGIIRRSFEYLDVENVKKLFTALVRPHLEYCNVAWSPRLLKDKRLIEAVQRRATKLVPELENLPYPERLQKLDLPSLSYRRARGDMIEVYKYTHGFYTVSEDLLQMDEDRTRRGHTYKLKKRYCRTSTRKHFFSFRVVDSWNSLPESVVSSPTLNTFKNRLDKLWKQFKFMPVETEISKEKIDKTLSEELLNNEEIDQLTGN